MTPKDPQFRHEDDDDDCWHDDNNESVDQPNDSLDQQQEQAQNDKQAVAMTLENLGLLHRPVVRRTTRFVCRVSSSSIWNDDSSSSSSDDDDDDNSSCDSSCSDESEEGEATAANEALFLEFEETHISIGTSSDPYGLSCRGGGGLYGLGGGLYGLSPCPQSPTHNTTNDNNTNQDEDDKRREIKHQQDEQVFMSNLNRRSITFVERDDVQEYEPAPLECHPDLYYSCHQLQKFHDEAEQFKQEGCGKLVSADV
eukprot:CAMPEP_0172440284 /NCGR_PEP_ID=MMETSP1065-20121228/959_1 /TAXON_ID=265537 /ORGANISM="Amphiprora paludosa, Strain CCMP125" /LENGTH=253 /DNA_ID=CAMNT_0013189071 /DNA_START=138 /DNA_END=899 /DNA_ORIENTATION=-